LYSYSYYLPLKIYTMKKVFALVFALGAMTAVFAQGGYGRNESRDVILGQPNRNVYDHNRNGNYYGMDRQAEINRINQEYNWRIQQIQHDRYLRRSERRRQIRFLEAERDQRIREVMRSYNDRNYNRRDRDHDHDRDDRGSGRYDQRY